MKRVRRLLMRLLCTALALALGSCATAGSGAFPTVRWYEGRITAITIDKCGLKPGTCEGSLILAPADGGREIILAIQPQTRLRRGEQDMVIEDLSVGNEVKVEAEQLPGQLLMHGLYLYRGFGD